MMVVVAVLAILLSPLAFEGGLYLHEPSLSANLEKVLDSIYSGIH